MSPEFTQRIGVEPIAVSMFEDAHGFWAKRWDWVVRVRIEFTDGVTTFLTPAEYKTLPKAQQVLIDHAPSTKRPDEGAL
jgi:hypothetical protein